MFQDVAPKTNSDSDTNTRLTSACNPDTNRPALAVWWSPGHAHTPSASAAPAQPAVTPSATSRALA